MQLKLDKINKPTAQHDQVCTQIKNKENTPLFTNYLTIKNGEPSKTSQWHI